MRGILFDLDGVVYNSETLIEGAPAALAWVRKQSIPHLFVTNTTSRGRSDLVAKLANFGIAATADDIMTPPVAARQLLASGGSVALFVREKTRAEFAGLPLLDDAAETGAQWVVAGDTGDLWDFRTLNRAFRLLYSNPEATLVALGMTAYWQAHDGPRLDTAPFIAALECAAGRKAVVMGKPAAAFFHAAAAKLGLKPGDVTMLGDDVRIDVGGAQAAGLQGVLVRTGKFRPGDLERGVTPDAVIDSIAALPEWWR